MIIQMDKMSAPSRELAQRLYEKVPILSCYVMSVLYVYVLE